MLRKDSKRCGASRGRSGVGRSGRESLGTRRGVGTAWGPWDEYEVNPESWTQLKGSNEKGI